MSGCFTQLLLYLLQCGWFVHVYCKPINLFVLICALCTPLKKLFPLLKQNRVDPDQLAPELGRVAQSVTCLATDASLTADPGVASSIPARSHSFVEIDYEIISTVIHLPSAESFKKDCYQFQAKVCARSSG